MAENIIKVRQKQRCDTEANWTSKNPVLLAGEIAISSDKNGLMKVGDGKSLWTAIPYSKASLSKTDVTTALGYTPPTTNTTYSIGTSSTAGIVKLYTGTGSNTDGAMTQAAIKSALNGKSGTDHTHTYIIDCGNNASKTTLAYSKAGLGYSEYTWLAAWNGYELRAVNKNQFATSGHTHSQYYDSTISRTTNTVLAAPNGSNGGATFRALMEEDLPRHNNPYYWEFIGTSGQDGYIKIMTIKPTVAYQNQPMTFLFGQRGVVSVCRLSIEFTNAGSVSTTEVNSFTVAGAGMNFYIVKSSAGVFDVYVKKIDKYDSIVLYGYWKSSFMDSTTITFSDTQITSVPSGYVQAGWGETVNRSAVSNRTDNSIIVQLNGGSTEGTNKFTFNGSASKTINITPSAIGASAVGHSHGVLEDPTKSGANTTNFVSLSYYAKELDDSTSDYVAVWNKKGNQIGTQSKSAFVLASRTYNVTSGTIYLPWDDTSARAKLPTIETLTRWNGAYDKNGGSVLAYCNQGAFANGATCNITYGTSAPTGSGKKGDIYIQIS
nr:MAG TPA: hyaluronidase [Caudoviricetes sp.]